MSKSIFLIFIVPIIFFLECQTRDRNIEDYIDYWEITRTTEIINNSEVQIDTFEYQVIPGKNDVLILSIERNPIFKEGEALSDLYSTETLLFELDSLDSLVSPLLSSHSKLYRKVVAFSPEYGIHPLKEYDSISFLRTSPTSWLIDSRIHDFDLKKEFDFTESQITKTTDKVYY